MNEKYANDIAYGPTKKYGRITLKIMKDSGDVHQRIELPRLNFPAYAGGREIIASWKPNFESSIGTDYYTDANGFELVKRHVYQEYEYAWVSSTFYPVDSVVMVSDFEQEHALTVWNDRPQAGTVHYDGKIKLLIDRRTTQKDWGGVP